MDLFSVGKFSLLLGVAFASLWTSGVMKSGASAPPVPAVERILTPPLKISAMGFSPDGSHLAILAGDGLVSLWNIHGEKAPRFLRYSAFPLTSLAWNNQGNQLLLGTNRSKVILLDSENLQETTSFFSPVEMVFAVLPYLENSWLISGMNSGPNASLIRQPLCQLHGKAFSSFPSKTRSKTCLSFHLQSPQGELAIVDSEGAISLGRESLHPFIHEGGAQESLKWSGKSLLCTRMDGTITKIDAATGKQDWRTVSPQKPLRTVETSPDGKRFFSGLGFDAVIVWDAEKGEILYRLAGLREIISQIKVSPDGNYLAVGTCLGNVILWDLREMQIVTIFAAGTLD